MYLKETMILVDGEDKTKDIRLIQHDAKNNKMLIGYFKGNRVYPYSCSRVQKLENPKVIDLNGCAPFAGGMPVLNRRLSLTLGSGFGLSDIMVQRKAYFQAHFV